jgi:hypothetical protein
MSAGPVRTLDAGVFTEAGSDFDGLVEEIRRSRVLRAW